MTKDCKKQNHIGTIQSDNILAYYFAKSVKLIKSTFPELKYDLMKDQLKKTFEEGSRYIIIKNEETIQTEDTFLTEDFSQMTIQEGFNIEQEYNPHRSTKSQQTYNQELDTYYNRHT